MTFDSIEELVEAAQGQYGQDEAEQAQAVLAELKNYDFDFQNEDGGSNDAVAAYEAKFIDEVRKLEDHIGRKLSAAEINRLWQDAPTDHVPDLVKAHGEELGSRLSTPEGRQSFGEEVLNDRDDAALMAAIEGEGN